MIDALLGFIADPARAGWLFAIATGTAITLMAWALLETGEDGGPLQRRLRAVRDHQSDQPGPSLQRLSSWLSQLSPYVEPRKEERRRGLREQLVQAGVRSELALTVLYVAKFLLMVVLPAATAALTWLNPHSALAPGWAFGLTALTAYVGWRVPTLYLEHRVDSRKRTLLEGLPDALDLLVACTEAGLGLNAAIERVAEQLPTSNAELARELQQVNAEIRAGIDRTVALRNLADRTGLDDIRGLVALITHSMRFGTGIADTLRIYADEFRDRRTQRAEELAAMVGTKLIFPLCFCIFPAFFVVATGPAILGVIRVLTGGGLDVSGQ